jgi:RHS repeat-associated protein
MYDCSVQHALLAYQFTGKERDPESNLDNFGARYDSSSLGRFMSPDPKILSIRHIVNPQKWNKYAYTVNNPLNFFDPDGLEEVTITVRAFIPPQQTSRIGRYDGDNRGFSTAQNASSRAALRVTIETDPKVRSNPLVSSQMTPGTSVLRREDGSVIRSATAEKGLPTFNVARDDKGNVTINVSQDVKNAAAGPSFLTPGVSTNVAITVSQDASSVTVAGNHSQYPALEINAQVGDNTPTPVYQFTPSDPGDPSYLLLPNINVFVNKQLPPPPPPCTPDKDKKCL